MGKARQKHAVKKRMRKLRKIPVASNGSGPKPGVLIAIPSRGSCRVEFAISLWGLVEPMNMTVGVRTVLEERLDDARNSLAQVAISEGAEYVFFLDDDILLPHQTLRRLVYLAQQNPEWDLLTAICTTRAHPPEPTIFNERDGQRLGAFWDWDFDTRFPITGCGLAATLVRTSAFGRFDPPWFFDSKERVVEAGTQAEEADLAFCRKLRDAGGVLMADGGILCGHIDRETGKVWQMHPDTRPFRNVKGELLKRMAPELAESR
jgi:hypothetical protein